MKRLLFAVIFTVLSSVWAGAQTIADIARQERAKRPAATQRAVVVNNKTLGIKPKPSAETRPAEPTATTATTATTAPQAAPAPADQPPARDEKWWRSQFEEARTEVRRAENQLAVAQLELNAANRDFLTRSYDPDNRAPAAVAAATKRLDEANKTLTATRAKVAFLEEELRRAGAPAGWAR
jgi:hypothetical protein